MTKIFIVGTAVLVFIGLVGGAVIYLFEDKLVAPSKVSQEPITITNFKECVAAGNAVMESYPRQCRVSGQTFTEDIGNELEKRDLIRIENPRPNQTITSPLTIKGEARGFWFFEASFPIRLLDERGDEISLNPPYIMTSADWMTEDFVPFEVTIEFNAPASGDGTLFLQKDNPSGLPEHNDELRVPVLFGQPTHASCIITGCSGQVCADKEVVTTCEFLPEYACYQQATCERQQNGECGWTQTVELAMCLEDTQQVINPL